MKDKNNSILVIPSLFPKGENDIRGIFILDYLASVKKKYNVEVLDINSATNINRLSEKKLFGYSIYSSDTSGNQIIKLKYFSYLKIFLKMYLSPPSKFSKYKIIHAHGAPIHGNIARLISRKYGIPYVITEHTGPFTKISEKLLLKYLSKKSIEKADALLTVSKDLLTQIEKSGIKPKKTFITYNPVDTATFCMENEKDSNNNILFVGRLEEYKGAFRVVKAFTKLHGEYPEWTLTIVGEGPERNQIEKYLRANPELNSKIYLKGTLTKKMIAQEMNRSSFFVFPSEHETFGLVIAEAMACGLPVIVGNKTAPKEFVREGHGILIEPDNIEELYKAMIFMINNHKKYDSKELREYIVENFSIESFGKKINKIYQEVIR